MSQNLYSWLSTYLPCFYLICIISEGLFRHEEATGNWFGLCVHIWWYCPRWSSQLIPEVSQQMRGNHTPLGNDSYTPFPHVSLRAKAAEADLLQSRMKQFSSEVDSSLTVNKNGFTDFLWKWETILFFFNGIGGWMLCFVSTAVQIFELVRQCVAVLKLGLWGFNLCYDVSISISTELVKKLGQSFTMYQCIPLYHQTE